MALILEIRDRRGATTYHPLTQLPLTLGRGLSNDIIVDDPYVDARHVHITSDEAGALAVHDLGTVNGTLALGGRTAAAVPVQAGTELRIGRTTLRFRDRDEPVPPAFVEASHDAPRAARWALTPRGTRALPVITVAVVALSAWLTSTDRSSGSTVLLAAVMAMVLITMWAGIWAVAVRGQDRRFHMRSHTAVACAAFLLVFLFTMINSWLTFFFPDVLAFDAALGFVVLFALALAVAGHLTVAGVLTPSRRWRTGLGVAGILFLLVTVGALVEGDKFSDAPKFAGQLKPVPPQFVPTRTVDQFVKSMADAKKEADKSLEK